MSPQKMAETRKALFLLGFSLLSISRFGRVDSGQLIAPEVEFKILSSKFFLQNLIRDEHLD